MTRPNGARDGSTEDGDTLPRAELIRMARDNLAHVEAGTIEQADTVMTVPAAHYVDEQRWRKEVDRVFRRIPLMLAMSCELRHPGDFKTLEVCDVPVLLVRGDDGEVRAFINSCSHRGAAVVVERRGSGKRFSCPYHAWTYDRSGALVAVFAEDDFGGVDKSCQGLRQLPAAERAGMIWVTLNSEQTIDIDEFLCGYDRLLGSFGFADWSLFEERELAGPNWKIAYDGYLDLYHLPILHRNTFGTNMPHQVISHAWGPHQRVSSPDPGLSKLAAMDEAEWPLKRLLGGVWTIFPHVSIASFDGGGGRAVMVSQLFPGSGPFESITVQNYVMERLPETDEAQEKARAQFALLGNVVRDEDYAAGFGQQQGLRSRAGAQVLFGRNEVCGQRFHQFLNRLVGCETDRLTDLFRESCAGTAHASEVKDG